MSFVSYECFLWSLSMVIFLISLSLFATSCAFVHSSIPSSLSPSSDRTMSPPHPPPPPPPPPIHQSPSIDISTPSLLPTSLSSSPSSLPALSTIPPLPPSPHLSILESIPISLLALSVPLYLCLCLCLFLSSLSMTHCLPRQSGFN